MRKETVEVMREAAEHFIDYLDLQRTVCERIAELTKNEAAFVTTGAAGGVVLSTAACMCAGNIDNLDRIPDKVNMLEKNEVIIFDGEFQDSIPYWKLIRKAGAKIVSVKPDIDAVKQVVNAHTAAVFLFPSSLYERGIPTCEEVIPELKNIGVPIVVDAAAQLPPRSNLWYYTNELGADLVIFSGGKHIRGPQSTGLILGKKNLIDICKAAASPNAEIGRPYKTGKEELAGILTALEFFMKEDDQSLYDSQYEKLMTVKAYLNHFETVKVEMKTEGRLGTFQPLLLITFPEGIRGESCHEFARKYNPPIDIGVYQPEFKMPENTVFINAYNLSEGEQYMVGEMLERFCEESINR